MRYEHQQIVTYDAQKPSLDGWVRISRVTHGTQENAKNCVTQVRPLAATLSGKAGATVL